MAKIDDIFNMTISKEDHKKIHEELFEALDILVADFIFHTSKLPSKTTLMKFMEWSAEQKKNPTE